MKVRVTLMTENDKHMPETLTDEQVHNEALRGWEIVTKLLSTLSDDEKCTVESVEVVER